MQNKKYLFDNLKDGDLISFHFKSFKYLVGVFIGKVTGKTGNDLKVPGLGHIGIVTNVNEYVEKLSKEKDKHPQYVLDLLMQSKDADGVVHLVKVAHSF